MRVQSELPETSARSNIDMGEDAKESLEPMLDQLSAMTGVALRQRVTPGAWQRFVAGRLQSLGLPCVDRYAETIANAATGELARLLDVITVPHTWFCRDLLQLRRVVDLMQPRAAVHSPIRIWVAGCGTGEDAYSLAMLAHVRGVPVQVFGSDINPRAIERAKEGLYGPWSVRDVPPELRPCLVQYPGDLCRVRHDIRGVVSFGCHNLIEAPPCPAAGVAWDLILCRHVLGYLVRDSVAPTIRRLVAVLESGGWLVIGAKDLVQVPPSMRPTDSMGSGVFEKNESSEQQDSAGQPNPCAEEEADRGDGCALLDVAHGLFQRGELLDARLTYEKAAEMSPMEAEPHLFLGILHFTQGEVLLGRDHLRRALFLDSTMWLASFYLALCYERLGEIDGGARDDGHIGHLDILGARSNLRPAARRFLNPDFAPPRSGM